jgi:hypothetical protein
MTSEPMTRYDRGLEDTGYTEGKVYGIIWEVGLIVVPVSLGRGGFTKLRKAAVTHDKQST